MSNQYFDFKKFRIRHDQCAMKVGTDAVLLGSWVDYGNAQRVLDIGCGSGILSLMAAQRATKAAVHGIDVDASAVAQSQLNADNSPFANRLSFEQADVRNYSSEKKFDLILCNPPFYTEDTLSPDGRRSLARNACSLSFADLVEKASALLTCGGTFHVVLPFSEKDSFLHICAEKKLWAFRICQVRTTERKAPKRILISCSRKEVQSPCLEELVLSENGKRSEQFSRLTADFYLDVPQTS